MGSSSLFSNVNEDATNGTALDSTSPDSNILLNLESSAVPLVEPPLTFEYRDDEPSNGESRYPPN